MKLVRDLLGELGAEQLKTIEARFTPLPSNVESVTVIIPTPKVDAPLPGGKPMDVSPLWVVTTKQPYNRLDLIRSLAPLGRTKSHRSLTYFFEETAWSGLVTIDDRTFVYGSEEAIVQ